MHRIVFLLSLSGASVGLSMRAIEPMLPVFAEEFAISVPVAGNVITVFALAYGIGQFMHGPLGDRYGKLRLLVGWMLASALALVGCAMAGTFASLTAWRTATGIVSSAPFILGMAYIGDTVPMERRQEVVVQYATGNVLGHAFAPLLSGMVTDAFGWRATFLVIAAFVGSVGIVLYFSTRHLWADEKRIVGAGSAMKRYAEVIRLPRARTLAFCALMEAFFFFGAFAYVGAMLKLRFDLSYTLIGLALAGFGIGGFLFNITLRWLLRFLKPTSMVLYGGAICGLCFILVAWMPYWPLVYPLMIAVGYSFYMLHCPSSASPGCSDSPPAWRSSAPASQRSALPR
jgi:MFS transporter, YNFM family, putative membrane transport protein